MAVHLAYATPQGSARGVANQVRRLALSAAQRAGLGVSFAGGRDRVDVSGSPERAPVTVLLGIERAARARGGGALAELSPGQSCTSA